MNSQRRIIGSLLWREPVGLLCVSNSRLHGLKCMGCSGVPGSRLCEFGVSRAAVCFDDPLPAVIVGEQAVQPSSTVIRGIT